MSTPIELPLAVGGGVTIAATAFAPHNAAADAPLPVLFLVPGGGMCRRYFDIQIEGGEGYSQARWFAARGFLVVIMDYPGAGDSTLEIDGLPPSREQVEAGVAEAVRQVATRLRAGELLQGLAPVSSYLLIGGGHSVGGHVIVGTQARHAVFDGIAPLGASMTLTRLKLLPGKNHPYRAEPGSRNLASVRAVDWRNNDHWPDVPDWVLEQDYARKPLPPWRTSNMPVFSGVLVEPFASASEAANVRVPVLLIYGEQDVTAEPLDDVGMFRSAPSVSLLVVPGMGHNHSLANSRAIAWRRLELFAAEVAALREMGIAAAER